MAKSKTTERDEKRELSRRALMKWTIAAGAAFGVSLFNASNQCEADGITCLIGVPATASHVELCNLTVAKASDVETGKKMAVAALLAAAHTCE